MEFLVVAFNQLKDAAIEAAIETAMRVIRARKC